MTPNSPLPAAIIFDMDGVLVDSNPFHLRKWAAFLREHHIPFEEEKLAQVVLGPANEVTFRRYFGEQITPEQMQDLGEEVEETVPIRLLPKTSRVHPFPRVEVGVGRGTSVSGDP